MFKFNLPVVEGIEAKGGSLRLLSKLELVRPSLIDSCSETASEGIMILQNRRGLRRNHDGAPSTVTQAWTVTVTAAWRSP